MDDTYFPPKGIWASFSFNASLSLFFRLIIFLAKRYTPKTHKATHRIIKALFIQTNVANPQNHNAQIISQILPTNSCNQDITPLSFGLVYQVTSAEVTGDNKAIIREIRKLKITIAINQL